MIDVLGRDTGREAYRVRIVEAGRVIDGYVPERLIGDRIADGPRHQDAYEWIARNARSVRSALLARADGCPVRAPYSAIFLAEEL